MVPAVFYLDIPFPRVYMPARVYCMDHSHNSHNSHTPSETCQIGRNPRFFKNWSRFANGWGAISGHPPQPPVLPVQGAEMSWSSIASDGREQSPRRSAGAGAAFNPIAECEACRADRASAKE